jgi:hypothetical protein
MVHGAANNSRAKGTLMENVDTLIHLIEQPLNNLNETPMLYMVKAGDTLSQIITQHYDIRYHDPRYKFAQASVLYFNKSIKDPNEILSGQLLRLMPLAEDKVIAFCPVPDDFYKKRRALVTTRHRLEPQDSGYLNRVKYSIPLLPKEQDAFWALAWLEEHYGLASVSAASGFNAFGGFVSQSHNAFIAEVKTLYSQYQSGAITENQYAYRRQQTLKAYAQKLGPFEKVLLKGKTAREAIRITRSKALPATAKIDFHLQRLNRMAQVTKYGGVVLSAAGVGMGCYQIANTKNQHKKNEIFVETIAGSIAGIATGAALTLFFVATPAGWVTALVLGGAAALGSWGVGQGAAHLYNRHGEKIDIVGMSGVDQLCK